MPVPASPTGLVVTPQDDAGNVLVTWTNPGAITGNRIEVSLDGGTTWLAHYDSTPLTTRTLHAVAPQTPLQVRVTARNASGTSPPLTSPPVTLGLAGYLYGVRLRSTRDTTLTLPLGVVQDEGQGWDAHTTQTQIEVAGQAHYRTFFSALYTHQYDHDFLLPPFIAFRDGSRLTSWQQADILDRMEGSHDTLLYTDYTGLVRYCHLGAGKRRGYRGPMLRFQASLYEDPAPTFPLTS